MFSIVCPTMWKGKEFGVLYPKLLSCLDIGEIIIINNEVSKTPTWIQPHSKVRMLDFGKNIYVNPAWNIGVKESKYDQICLLSDDINFHESIFQQISQNLTNRVGMMGMHFGNLCSNMMPLTSTKIQYQDIIKQIPDQLVFGCLMFVHKENYKPIPEEFKIYYGVEYLCAHNFQNLKKLNHYIRNMQLQTNWGTTSHSSEFNALAFEEHSIREKIFKREFDSYKQDKILTEEELKEILRKEGTLLQQKVNAVTNAFPSI